MGIFSEVKLARIGTQSLVDYLYSSLTGVVGKPQLISLLTWFLNPLIFVSAPIHPPLVAHLVLQV